MKNGIPENVDELIAFAGGSVQIAAFLNRNQWNVERWRKTGVPENLWQVLAKKYELSLDQMAALTNATRKKSGYKRKTPSA